MPGTPITTRRPLVVAAACVVLLAIGVTAMLALSGRSDPEDDLRPAEVGRAGGVVTTPPSSSIVVRSTVPTTSTSTTIAPVTSTSAATAAPTRMVDVTSVPAAVTAIGDAVPPPQAALVGAEAFGNGWIERSPGLRPVEFAPGVVSAQCAPFVKDLYEPMSGAPSVSRVFQDPVVGELAQHHVTVLPTEDDASRMFGVLTSSEFADCALTQVRMFNALRYGGPVEALATTTADDIVWYRYEIDLSREVTRAFLAVIVRVGPVVFYLDTLAGLNGDGSVMSDDAFVSVVGVAVDAAQHVDA